MKELSIEEKAKAYDELLDKAKQIYNKENDVLIKHIIKGLFPELKESDDERIRKAMTNEFIHLQSKGYKFAGLEGEEIIAWLEKQYADPIKEYWRGYNEGKQNVLDKCAKLEKQGEKLPVGFYYVNSEGKKFYSDTFKYGDVILHVEKQDKQKPAWSEEDDKNLE